MKRVYTNLAVLDVTERGFVVLDMAPGLTFDALQARTDAPLHRATTDPREVPPSPFPRKGRRVIDWSVRHDGSA